MKKLILKYLPFLDIPLTPFVYLAALLLRAVRSAGVQKMPCCRNAFMNVGVFPICDHYYEPKFDNRDPTPAYSTDRNLPGIDWNVDEQLEILSGFSFTDELRNIPQKKQDTLGFHFNNGAFESGDAEYWYQMIRKFKPKRIFEIGSGNSTLMARRAIDRNCEENPEYQCKHICIEPYEMPWLEQTGAVVVRKRIENVDFSLFAELAENDILFIDSSHVIRPQGDVLFEYLEVFPRLNEGVIVHLHDIFSPKNYLEEWLVDDVKFWNEQYLLEAFLSYNSKWRILGAVNYLKHHHFERLKSVAPYLTPDREPGSFYVQKAVKYQVSGEKRNRGLGSVRLADHTGLERHERAAFH